MKYVFLIVYTLTIVSWAYGLSHHRFLWQEFWLYVGLFFIPSGAVCFCAWLMRQQVMWQRVLGLVGILPALGLWGLFLLLVSNGFKIH